MCVFEALLLPMNRFFLTLLMGAMISQSAHCQDSNPALRVGYQGLWVFHPGVSATLEWQLWSAGKYALKAGPRAGVWVHRGNHTGISAGGELLLSRTGRKGFEMQAIGSASGLLTVLANENYTYTGTGFEKNKVARLSFMAGGGLLAGYNYHHTGKRPFAWHAGLMLLQPRQATSVLTPFLCLSYTRYFSPVQP